MEHIKKQLNYNLNKKGLMNIAESAYICYLFEQFKKEILDDIEAEAISFSNNVLKIKTNNSILVSEIKLSAEEIKKKIHQKIGKKIIAKIEVGLKF